MRIVLPVLLLAACSPIESENAIGDETVEREWPSILETKPTDPVVVLAAEADLEPVDTPVRKATDRWVASDAGLRAEVQPLVKTLEADRSLAGWGTGGGVAQLDLALTEDDWDALVAEQEWDIPPYIEFSFVRPLTAPAIGGDAKDWVRVMPVEPVRTVFQLEALGTGRIFLEDGCLYVGNPEGVKSLAFFHAETGVDIREGGLVLVDRITGRTRGRVGEDFSWGAPNPFKEAWDAAKELREACGTAAVVNVGNPEASSVFQARYAGTRQVPDRPPAN